MSDATPAARLGVYALILAVVFAVAYAAGAAFMPDDVVHRWTQQVGGHSTGPSPVDAPAGHPAAH